jgi:excisionase family DNA binding protein
MNDLLLTPIRLDELETLIENSVTKALTKNAMVNTVNQSDTKQLLTVKEAAKFLNLTVQTIYLMVSRGDIPVNKKNRRLYFLKSELTEWIKQGRQLTNSEIENDAVNYLKPKNSKSHA